MIFLVSLLVAATARSSLRPQGSPEADPRIDVAIDRRRDRNDGSSRLLPDQRSPQPSFGQHELTWGRQITP